MATACAVRVTAAQAVVVCDAPRRAGRTDRQGRHCQDGHSLVKLVIRPRSASPVSSDASAAFPPRDPVTVGLSTGPGGHGSPGGPGGPIRLPTTFESMIRIIPSRR
jgi:hypothetical protein